jgi:hypothetical protein
MAESGQEDVDRSYWDAYRGEIDRSVRHAQNVSGYLRQAAAWVAVLIVIGVVATVAAVWSEDQDVGIQAVGAALLALPALLLLPLCAWALSSLVEVQAWRLDVAMLEADVEDAVE